MFQDNPKITAALKGIQGGVVALIIVAAYRMAKTALFDKTTMVVCIGTVAALVLTRIHPLYLIGLGVLVGMAAVQIKKRLGFQVNTEHVSKHQQDPESIYPEYYI